MKILSLFILLSTIWSCSTVDRILYPQKYTVKKTYNPNDPVEVSTEIISEEAFNCTQIGYISNSNHPPLASLYSELERVGGNRIIIISKQSSFASGVALDCHPMTGLPLNIIEDRCQLKNESACSHLIAYHMSRKSFETAKAMSCQKCKEGMSSLCRQCDVATSWAKGEEIKSKLITDCDQGIAKSCFKLSNGLYGEGLKLEALKYAQISCVKGVKEGCNFQNVLIQEQALERQTQAIKNQDFNHAMQMNQINSQIQMNNMMNFMNGLRKPSSENTPLKIKANCKSRFIKDFSSSGGRYETECD